MLYMKVTVSSHQGRVQNTSLRGTNAEEDKIKEKDARIVVYETTILKSLGYIFLSSF